MVKVIKAPTNAAPKLEWGTVLVWCIKASSWHGSARSGGLMLADSPCRELSKMSAAVSSCGKAVSGRYAAVRSWSRLEPAAMTAEIPNGCLSLPSPRGEETPWQSLHPKSAPRSRETRTSTNDVDVEQTTMSSTKVPAAADGTATLAKDADSWLPALSCPAAAVWRD
ncbi:hypothetical protein E4U41_001207 [Claviceps citrina]|nr:hypothetical protein E4U41_001207 [Claviceps citrina]